MSLLFCNEDSWKKVGSDIVDSILEKEAPIDLLPWRDSQITCWRRQLPFYDDMFLLSLVCDDWKDQTRVCFLEHAGGARLRLNGDSAPIHQANAEASLRLDEANVADYLSFFCFFVRGDAGPFYVLERKDDPLLPADFWSATKEGRGEGPTPDALYRPPRLHRSDEATSSFLLSTLIFYGNALFAADMKVFFRGNIEMINDDPMIEKLPVACNFPLKVVPTVH